MVVRPQRHLVLDRTSLVSLRHPGGGLSASSECWAPSAEVRSSALETSWRWVARPGLVVGSSLSGSGPSRSGWCRVGQIALEQCLHLLRKLGQYLPLLFHDVEQGVQINAFGLDVVLLSPVLLLLFVLLLDGSGGHVYWSFWSLDRGVVLYVLYRLIEIGRLYSQEVALYSPLLDPCEMIHGHLLLV